MATGQSVNERIYMVIRQVPEGKVRRMDRSPRSLGPRSARQVGYALAAVREGMAALATCGQ